MELDGAAVLIVGGSTGIGRTTALRFAREGARVAIAGRDRGRCDATRAALEAQGAEALAVVADVRDTASVDAAVATTVDRFGRLDCAFNNAGWEGRPGPVETGSEDDWTHMIDLKLSGVWRGLRAQLVQMKRQGAGTVVNMAGTWGLVGFPHYAAYCAAAHGIVGLTRAAALEVAGAGIRVNAVCPGAVDAPMLDRMVGGDAALKEQFAAGLAIGRLCSEEDVAEAVVWLCSPRSGYVNGAALPLDGGG